MRRKSRPQADALDNAAVQLAVRLVLVLQADTISIHFAFRAQQRNGHPRGDNRPEPPFLYMPIVHHAFSPSFILCVFHGAASFMPYQPDSIGTHFPILYLMMFSARRM